MWGGRCVFVYVRSFSVASFSEDIFCVRLSLACRARSQKQEEEETCARTNDRVSGLSLLGEGGVSMCASPHRRSHQAQQTSAKVNALALSPDINLPRNIMLQVHRWKFDSGRK